jgi:hypothetical protein
MGKTWETNWIMTFTRAKDKPINEILWSKLKASESHPPIQSKAPLHILRISR